MTGGRNDDDNNDDLSWPRVMEAPGDTCQEIDADEVHFLESIGKGSFGVVYKALWRGLTVAVKKVETESEVNAFYNEVQQLGRVQHENIIYLYGACTLDLYKCLVMEYADGGSLYYLLHNSPSTEYNLAHGISWLSQCAKAVSYLHSIQPRPLLHRDLKPPNLLLTKGAKMLKVCDFGTACELSTNMTDNRGSAAWMAPEVFEGKVYTEKCDVYSWGIIMWEVLTRRVPFQDLGLAVRIMWAVHQRQRPPLIVGCPKLLENLMKRCWDHNQARRPRMEEVEERMQFVTRFLKGADEPISNPPTDTSSTDSYMSPCVGSTADHTSRDVSEIATTTATTSDPHHLPRPLHHHHHLPRPHLTPTDPSNPCHRRPTHHNHDNSSSTLQNEEDSICSTSGSEGVYPVGGHDDTLCSTGSSEGTYPALAPPVTPNSSGTGLDNLLYPLTISIPNSSPPARHDLAPAPACTPTLSPVRMRQHLSPGDPNVQLRRRSAEVPAPRHHHGHRRSSSYGTSGLATEGEREEGDKGRATNYPSHSPHHQIPSSTSPLHPAPPPPTHHLLYPAARHMPQYQIDPSMRAPGGSLGGLESALKYPDHITPILPPPLLPITAGTTTTGTSITTAATTTPTTTSSCSNTHTTMSTAYPSWLPYPLYGPEP
ncbi:hypothetical protein Pcinc_021626, partial [Petrolisthes cinctipes]